MKLLVTGGRDYNDYEALCAAMKLLPFDPKLVIHGGARGADTLATRWCEVNGVHYAVVPALWEFHRKAAGAIRNATMLLLKPDYCLALPGGKGTANMMHLCNKQGIPVWAPYDPPTTGLKV